MQCLLITPYGANLTHLTKVLEAQEHTAVGTESLGAGLELAQADLREFDAAIVVFPAEGSGGLPALLIEIGIAAARSLPLLMIVAPEENIPPALSGVRLVRAELDNEKALRLHVGLFMNSLAKGSRAGSDIDPNSGSRLTSADLTSFRTRLSELHGSAPEGRGSQLEQLVVDVLVAAGATVEQNLRTPNQGLIDAAASIPGEEHRLGLLLIEVKNFTGTGRRSRQDAQAQLQSYVLDHGGGLGLLIFDGDDLPDVSTPLVFSLAISQLIDALGSEPLAEILVSARNRAIHQM